jgi:hypothetical protein
LRYCAAVEKRLRLVEQKTPALVRWYIARRGVQHRENRLAYVGLELGLGLAWLLEIQLVKLLLAYRLFHRLSRANVHPAIAEYKARSGERPRGKCRAAAAQKTSTLKPTILCPPACVGAVDCDLEATVQIPFSDQVAFTQYLLRAERHAWPGRSPLFRRDCWDS